jgi:hypothetical protein
MQLSSPGECSVCGGGLQIDRLSCPTCGCALEGGFQLPRLARLPREEQRFIELFVNLSGNLKNMAAALGVSYPTVRGRLDNIIESLEKITEEDRARREELIDAVEAGGIPASLAAHMLEDF